MACATSSRVDAPSQAASRWNKVARKTSDLRPVEMLDLNTGEVLAEFDDLKAAAYHVQANLKSRIRPSAISQVMRGLGGSAAGHFWRRKGETSLPSPAPAAQAKIVEQICLQTDKVLRSFPSAKAAAHATPGCRTATNMMRVCRNQLSAFGFKWRYSAKKHPRKKRARRESQPVESCRQKRRRLASQGASAIGKRIKVYWPQEQQWFRGLVRSYDEASGKHTIHYDDGDRETLDLSKERIAWGTGTSGSQMQAATDLVPDRCTICLEAPMNDPAATVCKHVYCYCCIMTHLSLSSRCPLCRKDLGRSPKITLKSSAADDLPCFRSVEQLSMDSGEVLRVFPSASAASVQIPLAQAHRILNICIGHRGKKSERGFFWRFSGSDALPPLYGQRNCDGRPVEQLDLESGEVLHEFPSVRKAAAESGVGRICIRRVCERRGALPGAGGFFWRYSGDSRTAWAPKGKTCAKPVEQLCLKTGEVLGTFPTITAAQKSIGLPSAHIRMVCDQLQGRRCAGGYFWRWKGSLALPVTKPPAWGKRVQKLDVKDGSVVEEFANATLASKALKVDNSTLCRWCRMQSVNGGYRWRYVVTKTKAPVIKTYDGTVVGRKLQVWWDGDRRYYSGRVASFVAQKGAHVIHYDDGDELTHRLDKEKFRWVDQERVAYGRFGEVEVEQLCLKTGKVLATFPSVSSASRHVGCSSVGQISSVLRKRQHSAAGFFWRYKGTSALPRKNKSTKTVEQLCPDTGKVLCQYSSIAAAGKAVGIAAPSISNICNGWKGHLTAAGFRWRFADSS